MKTTLKILGLVFITAITMLSCESMPAAPIDDQKKENQWPHRIDPDDLYKLHHYIRPTKPIRIPDTMAILMRPAILENPSDTTENNECEIENEE